MQNIVLLLDKVIDPPPPLKEEKQSSTANKEKRSVLLQLTDIFISVSQDDMWYELYKSITNEKDMAEKDQQRMIRREKRKIKRK